MNENNTEKQIVKIDANGRGLQLRTMEQMLGFARCIIASGLAPRGLDSPEKIVIALQVGAELKMLPMQSLSSIMVVNGRASLYGDAPLGLVRQSGLLEYIKETFEGDKDDSRMAVCITKRKGDTEEIIREFSVEQAKRAGLWGKAGTWTQYPDRMMMYRARSRNLRDNFPDVLCGFTIAEEYEGVEMTDTLPEAKPKSMALLEEQQNETPA